MSMSSGSGERERRETRCSYFISISSLSKGKERKLDRERVKRDEVVNLQGELLGSMTESHTMTRYLLGVGMFLMCIR